MKTNEPDAEPHLRLFSHRLLIGLRFLLLAFSLVLVLFSFFFSVRLFAFFVILARSRSLMRTYLTYCIYTRPRPQRLVINVFFVLMNGT